MTDAPSPSAHLSTNLDLFAVTGFVVATLLVSLLSRTGAVGLVLALPLLLVCPGYVTTALLHARRRPHRGVTGVTDANDVGGYAVAALERTALAVGTSLCLVAVGTLLVHESGWGLTSPTILWTVSGYVLVGAAMTFVRRAGGHVPETPGRSTSWWRSLLGRTARRDTTSLAVDGVLVVSIVVAFAAVGGALVTPGPHTDSTDLHLHTQNGSREVAAGYPKTITSDDPAELIVGVKNDEHRTVEYTVVAELQRVETHGTTVTVLEREQVGRFEPTVEDGERWQTEHEVGPELTGDHLRLVYYLYRGDAPETPSAETAYRYVYVWVNASSSAETR